MANPYIGLGAARSASGFVKDQAKQNTPQAKAERAKAAQAEAQAKLATHQINTQADYAQTPDGMEAMQQKLKNQDEQIRVQAQALSNDAAAQAFKQYSDTGDATSMNNLQTRLTKINGGVGYEDIAHFDSVTEADTALMVKSGLDPALIAGHPDALRGLIKVTKKVGGQVIVPMDAFHAMHDYGTRMDKAEADRKLKEAERVQKILSTLGSAPERDAAISSQSAGAVGTPEFNQAYTDTRKQQDATKRSRELADASKKQEAALANAQAKAAGKNKPQLKTTLSKVDAMRTSIEQKLVDAGIKGTLDTVDMQDPKVRQTVESGVLAISKELGIKPTGAQLKDLKEIQVLSGLAQESTGNLNASNTGFFDSFVHTYKGMMFEGVDQTDTEGATAFAVLSASLAHSLYGASQTVGELAQFKKVLDSDARLGTVLTQLKEQLVKAQQQATAFRLDKPKYLGDYYIGALDTSLADTIKALDTRVKTVNYMEDHPDDTPAQVMKHFETLAKAAEIKKAKAAKLSDSDTSALDAAFGSLS